jgi:hypothetical protein
MANETPSLNRLIAARRALVDLDAIDENRSLSLAAINTIAKARVILGELLELEADPLAHDRAGLAEAIGRLRTKLKSLGQAV